MGFGGISIWQLLIILVIVVLIFGTKKLRGMGGDLGGAIKSFKKAVKEDKDEAKAEVDENDSAAIEQSAESPVAEEQTSDDKKAQ